jgi:DNA primase
MSNWLDFKSIKREANLESVLRHYRVDLRRSGKDQYRGRCPIHRGEGRDAFHANTARNVFHCFACGAGGTVLDFIAAMEHCSVYEAAEKLKTMTSSFGQSRPAPNGKELVTERRRVSLPLAFRCEELIAHIRIWRSEGSATRRRLRLAWVSTRGRG